MTKPKSKLKVKAKPLTIDELGRRLAAYHARSLKNDLSVQKLATAVEKGLAELHDQSMFLDSLTNLYPPQNER